jgi:tetratricopeptide (TPR) repeat protein/transglutaminase-like putative cysteine protease
VESARAAALIARIDRELSSPQALPDLLRLDELRDDLDDLGPLGAALDRWLAAPAARPDFKALARLQKAQLLLTRGQLPQARAAASDLAVVRAWAVIGPFDNEGRAGLAAVYPPETEGYDAKARYPGKEHEVSWRALPDPGPLGFVQLSSAIAPHSDVTVYAAAVIDSPRAQGAVLHFGASGATKLWLAQDLTSKAPLGDPLFEDRNQHPAGFDQVQVPVRLRAGQNTIVLKIAHGSGRLGFVLRLAGEKDEPLAAIAATARPPGAPAKAGVVQAPREQPGKAGALPKPPDALDELRARAAKDPADARAQEDLAILLASRRPDDETERLALHAQERASDAAPGDPQIELRLSRLEDRDQNKRRAALERALAEPKNAKDPAVLTEVLEGLARFRLERGDGWKALEAADRALSLSPARLQTRLLHARALDAVGLGHRGVRERLDASAAAVSDCAVKSAPCPVQALRARVSALRRVGQVEEARALLEQVVKARFDDVAARAEWSGLLLDRGDLDGALALISDALLLDPLQASLRLRAADLLSQNGRPAEAREAYARTIELSPDDADLHESFGRHLLRTGDTEGALAELNRSLELRPQNPPLRDLVRSVKPEERYAAPYLFDAAALANGPSRAGPDEDLEVLADLNVVKVFPNGLSSRTRQLVLRALTPRGVDQSRAQSVQFSPDRQSVRVEKARLIRKDGSILESKSEGERSLSEPWYGLYYDLRAKVVSYPQLQAGDVLELVTRVDDSGNNFFADYFGDFAFLQGTARKQHVSYVLLGPAGRTFYSATGGLPSLKRTEEKLPDGGTLLRFDATDVPRVVLEPGTPGWSDLAAWVHLSTYSDWESVGRFYWGLVKDQQRVTDEVRRAAQEAVAGLPPAEGDAAERAKIKAVYRYVLSKTRYVGLEFGINSFKPYPVETILSRRFGDCKDKASLMRALLEALGIDSRLVLLRMKRLGSLQAAPASLAVFNHAILYVPKYELYLDGTAEFHGSAELPADDHGAEVLIVGPGGVGSRFLRTPEALPQENTDQVAAEVELATDGAAQLRLTIETRGVHAPGSRRTYEAPDERKTHAEEQLAQGAFPGVKVTEVEVSDPLAIEAPFTLRLQARAPSFAARGERGALRFGPFGQRQALVEQLAPLSKRALPLRMPEANRVAFESRVRLPAGYKATLPEDASGEGPQGRWKLRYSLEAGVVHSSLELELKGGLLPPEGYGALRDLLGRYDQAVGRPVLAVPGASAALGAGSAGGAR